MNGLGKAVDVQAEPDRMSGLRSPDPLNMNFLHVRKLLYKHFGHLPVSKISAGLMVEQRSLTFIAGGLRNSFWL